MKTDEISSWPLGGNSNHSKIEKPHNMSPSKVIHCRSIAECCREIDLVQVLQIFGTIKAVKMIPGLSQGLVEFEDLDSAIACVTYNSLKPIRIIGCQIYVNYSKSSEINRGFNISQGQIPAKVLLITIINVIHQINVETIKKICDHQNIKPQRIVIFHKNGLQVLVEFKTVDDASFIQHSLNGCDIYPGCCTLKVEFSKAEKLNVHSNTTESYNVDINDDSKSRNVKDKKYKNDSKISSVLKVHQDFPQVQKILSHVLALNGYKGNNLIPFKDILIDSKRNLPLNNLNNNIPLLQTNFMAQNQLKVMDHLISPFANINTGNNQRGGDSCVALVYGVNNEKTNCNHLFNLFCLYGNVLKVKILVNKTGVAMIQYSDRLATELAIQNLNNSMLLGQQLQIRFSKHPHIIESHQISNVFDGTPSFVDYSGSRNNRFRFVAGAKNDFASRIQPVSKVLHYFNAPPDYTASCIENVFKSMKTEIPIKQASISRSGGKSSSGVLEFSSISIALEAIMYVNHVILHKNESDGDEDVVVEKQGSPFTFKLAFSTSDSVRLDRAITDST